WLFRGTRPSYPLSVDTVNIRRYRDVDSGNIAADWSLTMLAFAVSQPRTDSWQPAAALGRLLAPLRATAPGLVLTSALLLALAIPFMLGLWLDPRVITGAPAWLKPLKFAISTGAYTLTLAWVFTYLPEWRR